ncbi:MAG TPA: hypothetical protein VFV81_03825 [Verrucomicrobiae bacterium]|nr:hypothetical protein [Verrucomicrobiae bacterium]
MKTSLLSVFLVLAAGSLLAADAGLTDNVKKAAAALGNESYSWKTTVEVPANSRFRPGPTEGKTEKGGLTWISMSFGDNTTEAVLKGTNGAIKTEDNGWQSLAEAAKDNGDGGFNRTRFLALLLQNYPMPSGLAAELAGKTQGLTQGTNGISGTLTEAGAKDLLSFRPRRGNNDGPEISNAKGSVTFWIADGKLTKLQTHVTGTVSFNGNDRDVDRTTTTVISDVGSTKVSAPDEAKKKLE